MKKSVDSATCGPIHFSRLRTSALGLNWLAGCGPSLRPVEIRLVQPSGNST
jgi:hypothetical protein